MVNPVGTESFDRVVGWSGGRVSSNFILLISSAAVSELWVTTTVRGSKAPDHLTERHSTAAYFPVRLLIRSLIELLIRVIGHAIDRIVD